MAQNEMRAKPALPERVRSMEGLGPAVVDNDFIDDCSEQPDNELGFQRMTSGECAVLDLLLRFTLGIDGLQGQPLLDLADLGRDMKATSKYFEQLLVEKVNFESKRF